MVICQFHVDTRTCLRLDDGEYLAWFPVEQGLRHKCVFGPLSFDMFFVVVIHVTFTHFKVDKDIAGVLVCPRKKTEAVDEG